MSILSWLGIKQGFKRRSALDEFEDFAKEERTRQRNADSAFDEDHFNKAVDLVVRRLEKRGHAE